MRDLSTERFKGHTPGPWERMASCISAVMGAPTCFCSVADVVDLVDAHQTEANARLIEAAPDLLADRDRWRKVADTLAAVCQNGAALVAVARIPPADRRVATRDEVLEVIKRSLLAAYAAYEKAKAEG